MIYCTLSNHFQKNGGAFQRRRPVAPLRMRRGSGALARAVLGGRGSGKKLPGAGRGKISSSEGEGGGAVKKLRRWIALLAACLLLTGCSLGGSTNVDELLRAPKLSGEYGAIKEALDAYLGESAQLKYPNNGDFLSPFLSCDWDGDGNSDMAVLYQASTSANVCVAVLCKGEEGGWQVAGACEGLSDMVESVRFASLREGSENQILVGYSTQGDEYLAVYAWQEGALETIFQQNYTQYIIEDITGSGVEDLVLLSNDEANEKIQIQLLTAGEEGFTAVQAPSLSPEQFTGCAAISAGRGADGKTYLILDGWTGATGTALASVVLCYNPETLQLEPADLPGVDDLYADTLRYVGLLTSRDLDGDGVVEIPAQPEQAGQLSLSQNRRMDFVVWRDLTSRRPEKSFGLLDEEYGYYIELPALWQGNLLLTDSDEEDGAVELHNLSGEALYLTLRVVEPTADSAGWYRLCTVASRQVQVQLGPDAGELTAYQLSQAVHIL